MRVIVAFDFPDIRDVNNQIADLVVDEITKDTKAWSEDYHCEVWVEDVQGKEKEEA